MNEKNKPKKPQDKSEISDYFLRRRKTGGSINSASNNAESQHEAMSNNMAHAKDTEVNQACAVDDGNGLQQMEDRLLAAIKGMENKMDLNMKDLKSEFDTRFSAFEQALEQNSKKVQDLEVGINYANKDIEDMKSFKLQAEKETKRQKERLDEAGRKYSLLAKELEETKKGMLDKFNQIERRSREYSVRIKGMAIDSQRPYTHQAAELIAKYKLVDKAESEIMKEIEIAHPLKSNPNEHMIVRFHSRPFRQSIVQAAKLKINRVTGDKGLKVVEDLTRTDHQMKMKAMPQMKRAYEEGKRARFHRGSLIIDGKPVDIDL